MLSWIFELPYYLLFSLISVVITASLFVLSIIRSNRRGGWAFRWLTFLLTLWQWSEFAKNRQLPLLNLEWVEMWTRVSFFSVALVPPTFLGMVLSMTGRLRGGLRTVWLGAYGFALLLVLADSCGCMLGEVVSIHHGVVHAPLPLFWVFALFFVVCNALALGVVYQGLPSFVVQHRRLRVVFWAAFLGLALGFLDVVAVLWKSFFPIANLSAALYAMVLYWAIYRYNYWGGRGFVRELAQRLGWGLSGVLLFYGAHFLGGMVVRYSGTFQEAALLWGVFMALVGPVLWARARDVYRLRFPVSQNASELLLSVSRGLGAGRQASEMVQQTLRMVSMHFHFHGVWGVLKNDQTGVWEPMDGSVSLRTLPLLNREWKGPIGLRDLRSRLYYTEHLSQLQIHGIQKDWRLLRRLGCDIAVPVCGPLGVEAVLCLREGKTGGDSWETLERLLSGVGQILGDQLYLLRLTKERERERHLGELGLMAAGLAHEIKNPLEGVYGAAQILQEEGKGNARFVEMVLRESLRLNDVVHNFLNYARPYAVQPTDHWLPDLLQEWLSHDCVLDLPAHPLRVRVDASALHQILLNLIGNAKRLQPLGVPLRLVVRPADGWVECSCMDQGGGVPPNRVAELFEPFRTQSVGGNGLGLALSRKMARAMGGDLLYRPIAGGSDFCVRLVPSAG